MNRYCQLIKYIVTDIVAAIVAWMLFLFFRLTEYENLLPTQFSDFATVYNWVIPFFIIPLFWLFVHYLSGYYNQVFRKSRLSELAVTFLSSFSGCFILFFVLLLYNRPSYNYFMAFVVLFLLQFFLTYVGRFLITQHATKKIHNRIWSLNTLIIGTGRNAQSIATQLNRMSLSLGNKIVGFLATGSNYMEVDSSMIIGTPEDFDAVMTNHNIQEIIIAVDDNESDMIFHLLGKSYQYRVEVKTIPSLHKIIYGGIRMSTIYAMPLVSISRNDMPYFQQNAKRIFDVCVSIFVLIFLSPLFLIIGIKVKKSSQGPVFYLQERIGRFGEPFNIIKFRTMKVGSETGTPLLSSETDERITPFGKILRKYRLDELPQFVNVLKGNMSLVGYRPERQYFIDRIVEKAPHYYLLWKIRPGISSWGMVKYGYANSVAKMIERLEYDIIYIENLSLMIDIKILIYTFKIIFNGRGI